ncbi:uncharacterized protein LOC136095089 [Hydra vulgaris]|uniref:uncharacterized protein LOC136095089 n=1 Tax=Hydra vulgaris TaxID=6087 RepID=UPI0032E9E1A4
MDNCICSDELSSELSFEEFEVALNSVKRNKATGADEINGNVIIGCFDILKHILFKVFRASINQGIFPEQLKVAKVTPIFKEGDRSNISNYRPISVLSIFFEAIKMTIGSTQSRFEQEGYLMFQKIESVLINVSSEGSLINKEVLASYATDLNASITSYARIHN